jgi:hypothetical protein
MYTLPHAKHGEGGAWRRKGYFPIAVRAGCTPPAFGHLPRAAHEGG